VSSRGTKENLEDYRHQTFRKSTFSY